MVLIQLLLPTNGAAAADGLALLAQTRRELADQFSGLTAYLRSPAKCSCSCLMATIRENSWTPMNRPRCTAAMPPLAIKSHRT